ncbi:hypothetical protein NUW54_g164 [Trametes sanguinea]|uniref:Uncharacterized protein n=1 Tax=Trametes sanguinea TaxID=158606 RepID=A0ACC1Q9Y8_9APHY|nr:hypothetical protein NUW54_g164 [Trametes sanguinea]
MVGQVGCPSLLSKVDIHHTTCLIETGKADTATKVHAAIKDTFLKGVSVQIICHALKKAGMKAVMKRKWPFLSKLHRTKRYTFALSKKDWTVEDWKRVVWSDETEINRVRSDGRKWVWKKKGEELKDQLFKGTLKHGSGSLMFWGCFGWQGTGHSCKINGKIDADFYDYNVDDVIFQQDNDPKHTKQEGQMVLHKAQNRALKQRLATYTHPPMSRRELWERVQMK